MFNKENYLKMSYAQREEHKKFIFGKDRRTAQRLDTKLKKECDNEISALHAQEEREEKEFICIREAGEMQDNFTGETLKFHQKCGGFHPENFEGCK